MSSLDRMPRVSIPCKAFLKLADDEFVEDVFPQNQEFKGCFKCVADESVINRVNNVTYSKIPKISPPCISPSKYKPPQQTGNAKNPPLNCPSKYKPSRQELVLGNCPQIQSKTKQKR